MKICAPFFTTALVLASAACGSGSPRLAPGSATSAGTVVGTPVGASTSYAKRSYDSGREAYTIDITLAGDGMTCATTVVGQKTSIGFFVETQPASLADPPSPPTSGTTYKVGTSAEGTVGGVFSTLSGVQESVTSGSITLTTVTDSLVEGTFDVTFSSKDEVTGAFSAPVCGG